MVAWRVSINSFIVCGDQLGDRTVCVHTDPFLGRAKLSAVESGALGMAVTKCETETVGRDSAEKVGEHPVHPADR